MYLIRREVASCEAVLSSDEETETLTMQRDDHLALTGSALHSKDKCRKSLKLTSDQLVSSLSSRSHHCLLTGGSQSVLSLSRPSRSRSVAISPKSTRSAGTSMSTDEMCNRTRKAEMFCSAGVK